MALALFSSALLAPAQTAGRHKFDQEHLSERYDMPPAPPLIPVFSPRAVVPMGGYTSYQINVNAQGLNIVGDAANEPTMVVDPTNPNRMAVGWRQFNSIQSNFRQGGYGFTTDGGLHWTFPGVLENNVFRSDPVMGTTAEGVFHYNSLEQSFDTDEFTSQNQGQSWTKLGRSMGGDKQWIAIDRTNSSGRGFVYQLWDNYSPYSPYQFSRSTDGGHTWMNPTLLPNAPIFGTMDIGPNGELYLVGSDGSLPSMRFLRSLNAKNGAVTPTWDLSVFVDMGGDLVYPPIVNPGGLAGQAWIATDRTGPYAGSIYILASVSSNTDPVAVKFRRSTDGGVTWGPAIRVNDDPVNQNRYHWFGTLSVAPNGRIDACWLDTRNDASNATSQLYYAYSLDGGATFSKNIMVSPPFNSTIGWPQQNKIGDYMAMSSDNSAAKIVYPATFNGEQDVYYVRVPVGSQTLLPTSYNLFRGLLVSGQLSDLFYVDANSLVGRPGLVLNLQEAPLQVVVETTSPFGAPSDATFTFVGRSTSTMVQQSIALYNFVTGQYETLDTRATTLADSTVTVQTTGDRSRFVNQADGKMRAKVSFIAVGPTPAPWQASLNQTVWAVTP